VQFSPRFRKRKSHCLCAAEVDRLRDIFSFLSRRNHQRSHRSGRFCLARLLLHGVPAVPQPPLSDDHRRYGKSVADLEGAEPDAPLPLYRRRTDAVTHGHVS